MQPNPLDPVAGERLSHADKLFTSDLSINEFAFVMGNCVFHIAVQGFMQTLKQAGRNAETITPSFVMPMSM